MMRDVSSVERSTAEGARSGGTILLWQSWLKFSSGPAGARRRASAGAQWVEEAAHPAVGGEAIPDRSPSFTWIVPCGRADGRERNGLTALGCRHGGRVARAGEYATLWNEGEE